MTQEEKNILLKDLSGRVPYGVFVKNVNIGFEGSLLTLSNYQPASVYVLTDIASGNQEYSPVEDIRPYLRPLSSITEQEMRELYDIPRTVDKENVGYWHKFSFTNHEFVDYLNRHHFDYRGLIPMGLAVESPEGMYEIK